MFLGGGVCNGHVSGHRGNYGAWNNARTWWMGRVGLLPVKEAVVAQLDGYMAGCLDVERRVLRSR